MTNNRIILFQKLKKVRDELRITKDSKNPHFKNKYASLRSVLDAVNPLLDKHGLLMLQPPAGDSVVTQIIDLSSGESVEWFWPLPNGNPQQVAGASTYGRRYSVLCGFALEAEDDDGETAEGRGRGVADALARL